jgi:hypothetical protein
MKIITIPCLQDNFAYLLICTKTQQAAVGGIPQKLLL